MSPMLMQSTADTVTVNRASNKVSNSIDVIAYQSKDGGNQQMQAFDALVATTQCVPQQSSPFLTFHPQMAHIQNLPTAPPVTTLSQPVASSMLMRPSQGQC